MKVRKKKNSRIVVRVIPLICQELFLLIIKWTGNETICMSTKMFFLTVIFISKYNKR